MYSISSKLCTTKWTKSQVKGPTINYPIQLCASPENSRVSPLFRAVCKNAADATDLLCVGPSVHSVGDKNQSEDKLDLGSCTKAGTGVSEV